MRRRSMVGVTALKNTDRVGGTARDAAGDLRTEAPASYFTDDGHGFLKASDDNAADALRVMGYMGALEILRLAYALTHDKARKELVHE
jgi:hypothetical protein